MKLQAVWLLGLFAIAAVPTTTAAQDRTRTDRPARFSDAGRVQVAGTVNGHWSPARDGGWAVQLAPYLTYFVRDRIGLGLSPSYETGTQLLGFDQVRFHQVGLSAHAVFDVPVAERLSLLVVPSLGYAFRKIPPHFDTAAALIAGQPSLGGTSVSVHQLSSMQLFTLSLHLPFVYHASSSLVLGMGPYFTFTRLMAERWRSGDAEQPFGGASTTIVGGPFTPNMFYEVGLSSYIAVSF